MLATAHRAVKQTHINTFRPSCAAFKAQIYGKLFESSSVAAFCDEKAEPDARLTAMGKLTLATASWEPHKEASAWYAAAQRQRQ